MAYLPTGGGQSGSDNTAQLEAQTALLQDIKTELLAQGLSLDSANSVLSSINSFLSGIKTDTSNLSAISSKATLINDNLEDIEEEQTAQGLVQDSQYTEQLLAKDFLEEIIINQKIITKHLELITNTEFNEEDLCK